MNEIDETPRHVVMSEKLHFWTKRIAKSAVDAFLNKERFGLHETRRDYLQNEVSLELVFEEESHLRRAEKRLEEVHGTAPRRFVEIKDSLSLHVTMAESATRFVRHDFVWMESEVAHALTLYTLLLPIKRVAEYLSRSELGVLSKIAKFLRVPLLLQSDDDHVDCLLRDAIDCIQEQGEDHCFTPTLLDDPKNEWRDTSYAAIVGLKPIVEAFERHSEEINEDHFVEDLLKGISILKCQDPYFVLSSVVYFVEFLLLNEFRRRKKDTPWGDFRCDYDLYDLYTFTRDFAVIKTSPLWASYSDVPGYKVVDGILNEVLNEMAIDHFFGEEESINLLTRDRRTWIDLTEMISSRKNEPFMQAAYCAKENELECLLEQAQHGNWYAAMLGFVISNDSHLASEFQDICVDLGSIDWERPFCSFRRSKRKALMAREILKSLCYEPGANIIGEYPSFP